MQEREQRVDCVDHMQSLNQNVGRRKHLNFIESEERRALEGMFLLKCKNSQWIDHTLDEEELAA